MNRMHRILLIEDSPGDARLIEEMLKEAGIKFDLKCADRLSSGIGLIKSDSFDVVLLDLGLSDSQGLATLLKLNEIKPELPIIIITGLADETIGTQAVKEGAQDYLIKGQVDKNLLGRSIRYALERKRAEDEIRLHENRLKNLLDLHRLDQASEAGIFDFTLEASLSSVQSEFAFVGIMNKDESVLIVHAWSKGAMEQCAVKDNPIHFPLADIGLLGEVIRQRSPVIVNDYEKSVEFKNGYPSGHVPIKRFLSVPVFRADRIVAVAAVANKATEYNELDVSSFTSLLNEMWNLIEHKRAEAALRESETWLRTIMDSINAGIVIIDSETHEIVDANALALKLIAESKDGVVGNICHGYICPAEVGNCPITDLKQTIDLSERKLLNVKGDSVPILKSVVPVQMKDRMVLVESFVDITALKKSEDLVKNILEGVDEGFIIIDRNYRIILANRGFAQEVQMPVEDIIGDYCYKISHKCDKPCHEVGEDCAPKHTFLTGEPYTALHTHYTKDGNPLFIETKSYPIRDALGEIVSVIETCNNITDKRKLEEQLRHVQKMEAVGSLAGGIAHDFNNILNVIIGYSDMVMNTLEDGSLAKEQLKQVLIAAERAENLTKRLLLFSRKEDAEVKRMNVNDIVINMEKMLARIIGEDINLITDLMGAKAMVMADAGQMEQVLMNLATNARDAMPEGGSLTVRTEIGEIDAEFIKAYEYGVPGAYAVISVTDTGTGIAKGRQARIFDPFFTTKEVGKGTGLGLSMAYGIVKQHNGYLNVYSEIGKGTTFRIWLPVIEDIAEKKPEVEELVSLKGGTETILVAEDDAAMRELSKAVLESAGYSVITAEDGEDAVMKFMDNRDKIHLVILDMIMPGKNGKEASEEIRKLSPQIKTLFLSGYTMDIIKTREIIESGFDFIHKPVSPKNLLKKVREILDSDS